MTQNSDVEGMDENGTENESASQLTPAEQGSGGAQSLVGGRVSDRLSSGEPAPDGPASDADSGTEDPTGTES